jgi:hypothetical protein
MALPAPEPGLVLSYSYLWHDEHLAGQEEGLKNRPSVIIFCTTRQKVQAVDVMVLPITHAAPQDSKSAIEIPLTIKTHLGLDDARSWIVVTEGNEFVWPGHDLRKVPHTDEFTYGFLPPRFFGQIRDAVVFFHKAAKLKTTPRG